MSAKQKVPPFGLRQWLVLITIGLFGQIAWVIENMYLHLFVYHVITDDPHVIASMVAASAVVATLTTILVGSWSDHVGKRKAIVTGGYVLWGLSTMLFAAADPAMIHRFFPAAEAVRLASIAIVLLDCVMTFFGSSANDAVFNAWVTDMTIPAQRGRIQAVLAAFPLLAMLLVFGLFDPMTQAGRWDAFFFWIGGMTIGAGVLNLFLMRESSVRSERTPFREKLTYGMRPSVIRENKGLYLVFALLAVESCAVQVYMPYLLIYIQNYLKLENYVVLLAVVLIGSSAISIASGRLIDRVGKLRMTIPALLLELLGLLGMYAARRTPVVAVSAILMLSGFMILSACANGLVQDRIPGGMAGRFQGIRMIFAVLIPMVIGPFIGSFVIQSSNETYVDLGVVRRVPSPEIFLAAAVVLLLALIPYFLIKKHARVMPSAPTAPGPSVRGELLERLTPYAAEIGDVPLPENPRPQLSRDPDARSILNGTWLYAIRRGGLPTEDHVAPMTEADADGHILVPFSPESQLSGVLRRTMPEDVLRYEREIPQSLAPRALGPEKRLLLHFGAVDQSCRVYLNGALAGEHHGGYFPFTFDVTDLWRPGANRLAVFVVDPSQTGDRAYGKQTLHRGKIWYSATSGIWQTVWLEAVPRTYIEDVRITPLFEERRVRLEVLFRGEAPQTAELSLAPEARLFNEVEFDEVELDEVETAEARVMPTAPTISRQPDRLILEAAVPDPRPWTPETPFLIPYRLQAGGDAVTGYFAMRSFGIGKNAAGEPMLLLNGIPTVHVGLLDQGYWSDGIYTPAADRAMSDDILRAKRLGFNMLRKHIKIEPMRWYYHCDRLGMLVWQDMVSGGGPYRFPVIGALPFIGIRLKDDRYKRFGRASESSRAAYLEEARETVRLLYSVPSIALWVPFNEGWGQFDAAKVHDLVRSLDPTRPIDHASGWHDQGVGDIKSLHIYFRKVRLARDPLGRPVCLTEFGGYNYAVPDHLSSTAEYGYKRYASLAEYQDGVLALLEDLFREPPILAASVYTQLSDVEDEVNGLTTYDRQIDKWPAGSAAAARLRDLNARLKERGRA